nr:hypothetical protein [Candidatus Levybacteria bacterium]
MSIFSIKKKTTRGPRKKFKNLLAESFVSKRQKFILSVISLSLGLFIAEHFLGKSGLYIVFALSIFSAVFLYMTLKKDLEDNFTPQVFILPFLYSLSVGLFYLLVPARLITRIAMTSFYALGLYSLYLSQNIFVVSSIRTIQLLASARTVSLVLTLLSYFFISNVVFSFHINVFVTFALVFTYTFIIVLQAIWVHTLEKNPFAQIFWVLSLTLCLSEIALFLWFGPSFPTVSALFLTAILYVLIGLSHAWFDKRLFRSVILEYFWITVISFIFLITFTNWI